MLSTLQTQQIALSKCLDAAGVGFGHMKKAVVHLSQKTEESQKAQKELEKYFVVKTAQTTSVLDDLRGMCEKVERRQQIVEEMCEGMDQKYLSIENGLAKVLDRLEQLSHQMSEKIPPHSSSEEVSSQRGVCQKVSKEMGRKAKVQVAQERSDDSETHSRLQEKRCKKRSIPATRHVKVEFESSEDSDTDGEREPSSLAWGCSSKQVVGISPVVANPPSSFGFADPVLLHLAKTAKKPTFSGKQSDWCQFVADWEAFWAKATTGREMSDEVKLATFEGCLDEVSRQELALLRKMKAKVSYTNFFAKLEANFGKNKQLWWKKRCKT